MQEHQSFMTFEPLLRLRLWMNKLKMPAVLFWHWKTGIFLPPSTRVHVVVGRAVRQALPEDGQVTR